MRCGHPGVEVKDGKKTVLQPSSFSPTSKAEQNLELVSTILIIGTAIIAVVMMVFLTLGMASRR